MMHMVHYRRMLRHYNAPFMNQNDSLYASRHSAAHILALVTKELFPGTQLGTGPVTEDGFYYDMKTPQPLSDADLKNIEKLMKKRIAQDLPFVRKELSLDDARALFHERNEPYKLELIDKIAATGAVTVSIYRTGDNFVDLCDGPHVERTRQITANALMLTRVGGAYWQADESNDQMTRVSGVLFATKDDLITYKERCAEAARRDHRKLGKELDLFTFSDLVGPGLPLFTPRGTAMRDAIVEKIQTLQAAHGYQRVTIPHITKIDLYETSGHARKFADELFKVRGKGAQEFVMKPMNCPHHTQIYAAHPRSYRDLPLRYMETTMVYRDEQAGELLGLSRVRAITQDDGHVFCTPEQIKDELRNIISVIRDFYTSLNLFNDGDYWVSISVRDPQTPEDYIGDIAQWNHAEQVLHDIAEEAHLPYKRVEGEAAFYGPKLDFMFKDALGRERQLGTAQLDFVMPQRFGLTYTDADGNKQTPVMIHRAIAGSLERFMAIAIEHFAGAFPFWLAPVQVVIIPVSDTFADYGATVLAILRDSNIRAELRNDAETLGRRIRAAQKEKIPYMLIVGEKEVAAQTVAVRSRDTGDEGSATVDAFIKRVTA